MSRATIALRPKRGKKKFYGITQDAKALGVTRQHLWEVLVGNRQSKRLMDAYQHLQGLKP
jgi:hypothetical protein